MVPRFSLGERRMLKNIPSPEGRPDALNTPQIPNLDFSKFEDVQRAATGRQQRTGGFLSRLMEAIASLGKRPGGFTNVRGPGDVTKNLVALNNLPGGPNSAVSDSNGTMPLIPSPAPDKPGAKPKPKVEKAPSGSPENQEAEKLQKENPGEIVAAVVRPGSETTVTFSPASLPITAGTMPEGTQKPYGTITGPDYSSIRVGKTNTYDGITLWQVRNDDKGNGTLRFEVAATALPGTYRFNVGDKVCIFQVMGESPEQAKHREDVRKAIAEHKDKLDKLNDIFQVIHRVAVNRTSDPKVWEKGGSEQKNMHDLAVWAYELSHWMPAYPPAQSDPTQYLAELSRKIPDMEKVLKAAAVPSMLGQVAKRNQKEETTLTQKMIQDGEKALAGLKVPEPPKTAAYTASIKANTPQGQLYGKQDQGQGQNLLKGKNQDQPQGYGQLKYKEPTPEKQVEQPELTEDFIKSLPPYLNAGETKEVPLPKPVPVVRVLDTSGNEKVVDVRSAYTPYASLSVWSGKLSLYPTSSVPQQSIDFMVKGQDGKMKKVTYEYKLIGLGKDALQESLEKALKLREELRKIYGRGGLRANDEIPVRAPQTRDDAYHLATKNAVRLDNELLARHTELNGKPKDHVYSFSDRERLVALVKEVEKFVEVWKKNLRID